MDAVRTNDNVAWTRATYAGPEPRFAPQRYVNYLGDDEVGNAIRQAYGPNYSRLVEIKRRYDPDNVFRLNQNIEPTAA